MTACATQARKGRKRLGKEPFAHVAFGISPTASDAIDALARAGLGSRSSIARALVETGVDGGALDTFPESAAEATASDADGGSASARKPGPGRQRNGRDRLVNVSAMLEPEKPTTIEEAAGQAGLSRWGAMRRLLVVGYERMLVEGYKNLPAYKRSLRKKERESSSKEKGQI